MYKEKDKLYKTGYMGEKGVRAGKRPMIVIEFQECLSGDWETLGLYLPKKRYQGKAFHVLCSLLEQSIAPYYALYNMLSVLENR